MTEDEKLDVYIDQTLQIDRNDPANSQRVLDITGAWKMRASEPPEDLDAAGWRITVQQVMRWLDLGEPENPTQATSTILSALGTLHNAISQANTQVQSMALRDEIIGNQGKVLDAFAAVLELPSGSLYIDMIPVLQKMKEDIERALPLTQH